MIEVAKKCGTEPTLHRKIWAVVPIPAGFFSAPFELSCTSWKCSSGKLESKSFLRLRKIGHDLINHPIYSRHQRFPHQIDVGVIEYPHPCIPVRKNDKYRVHLFSV